MQPWAVRPWKMAPTHLLFLPGIQEEETPRPLIRQMWQSSWRLPGNMNWVNIIFILNNIFFGIWEIKIVCRSINVCLMYFHFKSNVRICQSIETWQESGRSISYIFSFENNLKFCTSLFWVFGKQIVANRSSSTCFYAEILISFIVNLITTIRPVKISRKVNLRVSPSMG